MSEGRSEDPKAFVIARELSEVHLLLDNLAANPAANLSAITAQTRPDGLDDNWIEQVCRINWPPTGTAPDQAAQAALLIRAKDYLNSLTYPASGASIAFTLLVTQEVTGDKHTGFFRRYFGDRLFATVNTSKDATEGTAARAIPQRVADAPSRGSMARAAYPDLVPKAHGFRKSVGWLCWIMVLLLAATCAMSWYVAFGNAQLGGLETAQAAMATADKRVDDVQIAVATAGEARVEDLCTLPAATLDNPSPAYRRTDVYQACNDRATARAALLRSQTSLGRWLRPLPCWVERWCHDPIDMQKDGAAVAADAAAMANIIGLAVLPFLYGVLGAAAAVVRALSRKTKHSLLAPRDLQLSAQQLALGAVVGASIGLFFGQTGDGQEGLLGPAPLSSSALSFVAGFGVESVFQTLEALILRVFNVPAPAQPPEMVSLPVRQSAASRAALPAPSATPPPPPPPATQPATRVGDGSA